VTEQEKVIVITEVVLRFLKNNANNIGRQAYEFRKQLQDLEINVALFSKTHLKPHMKFYIPNCDIH
jgi:hypothetical protein